MHSVKFTLFSTLATFLLLFSACANEGEQVNIYSARHYDTDLELYNQFEEQTGISVELIEAGSDELIARMVNEGENSPADVFITVDAGRLWRAQVEGVLQPVESEVLSENIPDHLQNPDGLWFGLSQRVRGIIYNPDTVNPDELLGYRELADDKWEGRICVRSSTNIYNQSLVASMIESQGVEATEEWARNFVSNFARSPQGGDRDQISAVAAGQCDIAIANHYYLARLAMSSDSAEREVAEAVEIYFPEDVNGGTHVNISGAGVAVHSPNPQNAIRFLEYLTTAAAQEYFAGGNYEYPINSEVDLPEILVEFGDFDSDAVNVEAYGQNNPEAVRLMDRAGWR